MDSVQPSKVSLLQADGWAYWVTVEPSPPFWQTVIHSHWNGQVSWSPQLTGTPGSNSKVSDRTQARKDKSPRHEQLPASWVCVGPRITPVPISSKEATAVNRLFQSARSVPGSVLKAHTRDAHGVRLQHSNSSWVRRRALSFLCFPSTRRTGSLASLSLLCARSTQPTTWPLLGTSKYVWNGWINKWTESCLQYTSWNHRLTPHDAAMNSSWVKPLQSYGRNEQHVILGLKWRGDWNVLDVNYLIRCLFKWQIVLSWKHSAPGSKPLS